jgi:hypothetical protein
MPKTEEVKRKKFVICVYANKLVFDELNKIRKKQECSYNQAIEFLLTGYQVKNGLKNVDLLIKKLDKLQKKLEEIADSGGVSLLLDKMNAIYSDINKKRYPNIWK